MTTQTPPAATFPAPSALTADAILSLACPFRSDAPGPRWWLCQTRGGYENRMVADLREAKAVAVLPKVGIIRKRVHPDGRRWTEQVERPLFPTYVFFHGDHDQRYKASRSLAAIHVIDVCNQRRLSQQLADIVRASDFYTDLRVTNLRAGQRVEIVAGALMGCQGYVLDTKPTVVHLVVEMLGQAIQVDVEDPRLIERI